MKKIQFTVDFGNNKKGDILILNVALASILVNIRNVAIYFEENTPIIEETTTKIESVVEPIIDETPEIVVKKTRKKTENVNN